MVSNPTQLIIEAGRTERQYWQDLWRYRELFYQMREFEGAIKPRPA